MAFAGCVAALLLLPSAPWHGLGEVSFDLPLASNPYDAAASDVRVVFRGPGGAQERLAYFDGSKWRAILTAPQKGLYKAEVWVNGKRSSSARTTPETVSLSKSLPGMVRVGPNRRFILDGGQPFWPIGANLGWNSPPQTVEATLAKFGKEGFNWSRIWACHWDGKNPYFPGGKSPEDMNPEVMKRWDSIVTAAEKSGVRFQFVLFHHGLFSTRVNSNWGEHPWNKAKGGFLQNPADFFTDPRAKKLARNWLRYAVARWGHSPSIMAWELFNEVEWVDAKYDGRQGDIGRWHREMAAYLRKNDPTKRLVTSSSEMYLPIYSEMDYYQPHGYPPSVEAMVLGAKVPKDKPFFYGEVGGASYDPKTERDVVRQAAWTGFLAGHAGASQYWYWDSLERLNHYREIGQAARFIRRTGLTSDPAARPKKLQVDAPSGGPLTLVPGMGWGKTGITELRVPEDALGGALGQLSSYLQGEANRSLFPAPLTLRLTSPSSGEMTLPLGPFAKAGARVIVKVNGKEAGRAESPARAEDGGRQEIKVPFPSGSSTIEVSNPGPDWAVLGPISFSGLGKSARGAAFGTTRKAALRLTSSSLGKEIRLGGLGLSDGKVNVEVLDLDSGATRRTDALVSRGWLLWTPREKEAALLATRQ